MIIELPLGKLCNMSPTEAVTYSFEYFFGTKPSDQYLSLYSDQIQKDHLNFICQTLSQWPNRRIVYEPEPKEHKMRRLNDFVSVSFLMVVPANRFLQMAYRDFFGREVDPAGVRAYGRINFALSSNRLKLLKILSKSQEFIESRRQVAWPKHALPIIAPESSALRWRIGEVVSSDWFAGSQTAQLGARFNPMLLWLNERGILYTAPGMIVKGKLSGNVLYGPPEWVFWGPKSPISKGFYKVRCEMYTGPNDMGHLDICSEAGTVIHKQIEFFGELKVELPLELRSDVADLEFRFFNTSGRNIEIQIQEYSISAP